MSKRKKVRRVARRIEDQEEMAAALLAAVDRFFYWLRSTDFFARKPKRKRK